MISIAFHIGYDADWRRPQGPASGPVSDQQSQHHQQAAGDRAQGTPASDARGPVSVPDQARIPAASSHAPHQSQSQHPPNPVQGGSSHNAPPPALPVGGQGTGPGIGHHPTPRLPQPPAPPATQQSASSSSSSGGRPDLSRMTIANSPRDMIANMNNAGGQQGTGGQQGNSASKDKKKSRS